MINFKILKQPHCVHPFSKFWTFVQKLEYHYCMVLKLSARVTRLGDLSPFGRLFKALGDNLFGPNRPNFWRLFGRFFKVDQNLKFLCYKIIIIAVNFQKNIFLKFFEKKLGNFCFKKDPKYAFLPTKTSKNWLGDFGRLFSLNWATIYSNHLVTLV